ncbi:sigma-70 family RNA polymerase sigma factor [Blastopirellula sp. JC732]|uniref:Sigma-70 family RNA polymerase sigma factor n=1 Tax=Blastopirellula sediminis TaxID=2894196 RepID=A0A9X1MLN2_9BACT|nr:sigma-70 family RNA polymerase sigma factor [Blastopirellula sediminis]MCC9609439.1 sigma-70 family RNA polymerase sigma factor [Blastopirellula sediminis]MCC9627784.1 sigma-70 family RNA polymerase sigma factor [Blastopirellula sediminis]
MSVTNDEVHLLAGNERHAVHEEQPPPTSDYEDFLRLFTRDQLRVLAYIRALVHDHAVASDVFQETSLELWRSFATFRRDEEFAPWALGIARHQVLKYWRTRDRDRHVFSETLLAELSTAAIDMARELEPRQEALDECVGLLSDRQRELIRLFYGENQSAAAIAEGWNRSVHAVYKSLKVMRRALLECVESKLGNDTA